MPEPGSLGSGMGGAGVDAGHGGNNTGGSFPTDPSAYDDYDLSPFGGPGDPAYGVGSENDGNLVSYLQEHRIEPGIGQQIFNFGQDIFSRAFGPLAEMLSIPPNPVVNPEHHIQKNRLENLLGEHTPAYNAAMAEAARRAEQYMSEGLDQFDAAERALSEVADGVEDGSFNPPIGRIEPSGPRSDIGDLFILPASFENPPTTPGTLFRDESDRVGLVLPTGAAVPVDAFRNLANTVRTGGTPGPNQMAVIEAMTPAQRRAAGIFLRPDGSVRSFEAVLTAAVQNAAAGRPLTTNQQAALGAAFLNTPSRGGSVHRDLVNQLAGAQRGEVRDHISAAVQDAMRATREIRRTARADTERQQRGTPARIAENAVGRLSAGSGFTARQREQFDRLTRQQQTALLDRGLAPAGRPNLVANIVDRAARGQRPTASQQRYLAGLTPPQRRLVRETIASATSAVDRRAHNLTRAVGADTRLVRQDGRTIRSEAVARSAARNLEAGRRLTPTQQSLVREARLNRTEQRVERQQEKVRRSRTQARQAQQARQQAFTTRSGRTRTVAQVLAAARRNQRAGRALTESQQQATRQRDAAQRARGRLARQRAALAAQQVRQARLAGTPTFTTERGREQSRQHVLRSAAARQAAGRVLSANQQQAVQKRATLQRARQRAAQAAARVAKREVQQARQQRTHTFTTRTGGTVSRQQVLENAAQRQAVGRTLTANQQQAVQERAAIQRARQAQRQAQQQARTAQERARQAEAARVAAARRAAAAPRNTGPLRNLPPAEQQRVLLTRAVARRQAGIRLTPNQLRALKSSTARERRAVR